VSETLSYLDQIIEKGIGRFTSIIARSDSDSESVNSDNQNYNVITPFIDDFNDSNVDFDF